MSRKQLKEGDIYVITDGEYNMLMGRCGGTFGSSFWQMEIFATAEYLQRNKLLRLVGVRQENLMEANDLSELAFEMNQSVEIISGVLEGDIVIIQSVHVRKVDGKWQVSYIVDDLKGVEGLMYREEELKPIIEG